MNLSVTFCTLFPISLSYCLYSWPYDTSLHLPPFVRTNSHLSYAGSAWNAVCWEGEEARVAGGRIGLWEHWTAVPGTDYEFGRTRVR